jgi:hypothetical protein
MPTRIPISEAKAISKKYHAPIVLIFAITDGGDRFTVTTYGESKALCRHAASLSEQISSKVLNGEIIPAKEEPKQLPDQPTQFESKGA